MKTNICFVTSVSHYTSLCNTFDPLCTPPVTSGAYDIHMGPPEVTGCDRGCAAISLQNCVGVTWVTWS